MGGFVYFKKSTGDAQQPLPAGYRSSLAVIKAKGLPARTVLERETFVLHVYRKMRVDSQNVLEFPNGDFIVACGTLLYKKHMGERALRELFTDFCSRRFAFEHCLGHFAIWIYTGGSLTLFNDYRGVYQVYQNADRSVIASAFLPVYETLTTRTPNTQNVLEYLAYYSICGPNTVLDEITVLDYQHIFRLLPAPAQERKSISLPEQDPALPFEEHVRFLHSMLRDHFGMLVDHFGDGQSLGLTGGLDSRLVLAHLRLAGAKPQVYVQGSPDSVDVRIARLIAAGEGFDIQYDPDEGKARFDIGEFAERLRFSYCYLDALPQPGLFDDWSLISAERSRIDRPEQLRLYGMGGETFRNSLPLRDRPCRIEELVQLIFDKADFASFGPLFSKRQFFANLARKVSEEMDLQSGILTRLQAELALRHCRMVRSTGPLMTQQNERAYSLVPFGEPGYVHVASRVPMQYKYAGRLERALIAAADPQLASYTSAYGYAFSDGPGAKARLTDIVKQVMPLAVRPYLRRAMSLRKGIPKRPFYLSDDWLRTVFPNGWPHIESYIDVHRTNDSRLISRALSIEIVLSKLLDIQ